MWNVTKFPPEFSPEHWVEEYVLWYRSTLFLDVNMVTMVVNLVGTYSRSGSSRGTRDGDHLVELLTFSNAAVRVLIFFDTNKWSLFSTLLLFHLF